MSQKNLLKADLIFPASPGLRLDLFFLLFEAQFLDSSFAVPFLA